MTIFGFLRDSLVVIVFFFFFGDFCFLLNKRTKVSQKVAELWNDDSNCFFFCFCFCFCFCFGKGCLYWPAIFFFQKDDLVEPT